MSPTLLFTLSLAVTLSAGIGVGLMRRFALRRAILDIPNERSSHVTVNFYNFMDGIDGLAGTEAAMASFAGSVLPVTSRFAPGVMV